MTDLTIALLGFKKNGWVHGWKKKAFSLHVACVHQTFMDLISPEKCAVHCNVHSTFPFISGQRGCQQAAFYGCSAHWWF